MLDSVPSELLELQARFETWRANRKYVREPIPDQLRGAAREMLRRYPPSLIHRVLKVDPSRLKKRPLAKRSAPRAAAPNKKKPTPLRHTRPGAPKLKSKSSSSRAQVSALPQPTFFKLPAVASLPLDSSSAHTLTPYRLQFERADGSRLTLTLPASDASLIHSLLADFLRGGKL